MGLVEQYPKTIRNVIRGLSKLPGIGGKTAERLAMHLLKIPERQVLELARQLTEMKAKTRLCGQCFALSDDDLCHICASPHRENTRICVVEQPADMVSIEKSGVWNGTYHILQGALSPIDGIGPDAIRLQELIKRVQSGATEVVLATGTSAEGESTAAFIRDRLKEMGVAVTRIASGVPMGGDVKYVDQVTVKKAMESRYHF